MRSRGLDQRVARGEEVLVDDVAVTGICEPCTRTLGDDLRNGAQEEIEAFLLDEAASEPHERPISGAELFAPTSCRDPIRRRDGDGWGDWGALVGVRQQEPRVLEVVAGVDRGAVAMRQRVAQE